MSTNNSLFPKEVIALVQHIELNHAGWWEKTIHRLVLAAVWLSDQPPNADAIQTVLKTTFKLSLSSQKLMSALDSLESRRMLLLLENDTYRIPEEQRVVFEKEMAEAEKVESEAKASFVELATEIGEGLEPERLWTTFEQEFLGPLIKQVGANAYRFIAGEKMTVDKSLVEHFLKPFPTPLHAKLHAFVTAFLDPKKQEVCAHVSRLLHARFCVEASGLPEEVLTKLNAGVGKQIRFRMFVDTNVLFSFLELHENPSNAAAQELRELIALLKGNPRIELVITPETIAEAKRSIENTKGQISGLPMTSNFTQAALEARLSGMAERFLTERLRRNGKLTAEEWFDPYLGDFVIMARSKGIELFNQKLDGYSTRQDVVDDILNVLKYEEKLPEARRKTYQKIAHDMVLWHFVNDKRPAYIESPIDAIDWIITVDFRLIGFDEHKQKQAKSKVPLCIHPTSLIQLLQFWLPRTKEFEEAMLGSLRLPFLFQNFDAEGELTSLKILKGIGRFEGSEALSQETITHVVLNEELRSRLKADQTDDAEIALIRDGLVEEMRLRAEADATKAKELQEEILKREADLSTLAEQKKMVEDESAATKKQKAEADAATMQTLASQGAELKAVKARLHEMEEAELHRAEKEKDNQAKRDKRKALFTYLGYLVLVVSLSVIGAWKVGSLFPWCASILGTVPVGGFTAIFIFILGHLILQLSIGRRPTIAFLWPFRQVKRFSKVLWMVVLVGFCGGVGGNMYANWIQKNIDTQQRIPPQPLQRIQGQ